MSQQLVTLAEIAEHIDAQLVGDPDLVITGISTLQDAQSGQLSFLANPVYRKFLPQTQASAVILDTVSAAEFQGNALILNNPYAGYAKATELFVRQQTSTKPIIHPSAVIAEDVKLPQSVQVGANAVIEQGVVLAENVSIGAGCFVGANTSIGANSQLYANVSVYHDVVIGHSAVLHSGVIIGGDGFGFAPDGQRWVKIHHLAGVRIGDDVELGANTCVDRGALADTVIGDGVKIDNMVQVAHGVKIGSQTVIAGCTAIAGSAEIGAHCLIGGGVGIVGHIKIADKVTITGMTLVTKSITEAGVYSSGTPFMDSGKWRKNAVLYGQLDKINKRLKTLEKNPDKSE